MITNMEGLSYEDRLRCLNLWSLEERRNRQDLIEVFADFLGKVNNRASGLVYIGKSTTRVQEAIHSS